MLKVSNVGVYDLRESVIACRNAMRTSPPEYTEEEFRKSLRRAVMLANTPSGSGHQNFLKGIRVSFDIVYPNYISPELQRYNWVDIVTSSSKMHRLVKMDLGSCFNKYVTQESREQMAELIENYNNVSAAMPENSTAVYEAFMLVLSNCPQGIELFMRVSTNYLQLRTIVSQRRYHKLHEWRNFCRFVEGLPYAGELILPRDYKPVGDDEIEG